MVMASRPGSAPAVAGLTRSRARLTPSDSDAAYDLNMMLPPGRAGAWPVRCLANGTQNYYRTKIILGQCYRSKVIFLELDSRSNLERDEFRASRIGIPKSGQF